MKKIFVAVLLLLTNLAIAQKMPDLKKGVFVTDFTHVLTSEQVAELNRRALEIQKKTGFQLIIVVMDALPKGTDVNDATNAIDENWKSSIADTTNRLIYVAGIKQHGHRLANVRGTKAIILFPKTRCIAIVKAMTPFYNAKNYNGGLQLMVDSVEAVLHIGSRKSSLSDYSGMLTGVLFIACAVILFLFMQKRKQKAAV